LTGIGWRALVHPKTHPVSEFEFEVIIGGDGRRNTLEGIGVAIIHFKIQLILKLVRIYTNKSGLQNPNQNQDI